jgi:hypothetical protein
MKKYLIVLATALVALAGCKGGEGTETKLSIKPDAATLIVGDTTRLAAVITPAEAKYPEDLVWSSSDTAVVKIVAQNGTITAVGKGEANVTVKSESLKLEGVCRITAALYEELWQLDWIYYFPDTEELFSEDTIELSGYKCLLKSYEFFCPNTLDFAEDLSAGEGPCVFVTAVVPVIAEGEYKGEMLARQFQFVDDETKLDAFTAVKGKFDPSIVGAVFQPYFEALDNEEEADIDWDLYETGVTGAGIRNAKITETGSISYSYVRYGIVTSGAFVRQVNAEQTAYECVFNFTAEWFGGFWGIGLATNWDAESYSEVLIQPFAYEVDAAYLYKTGEAAQPIVLDAAPARKAIRKIEANSKNWITREKPVRAKFAPVK